MTPPFKSAWIVGASSGIGRALALKLTALGTTVFASARSKKDLDSLVKAAQGHLGVVIAVPVDVTDKASVAAAAKTVEAEAGAVDSCVLCAGTYVPVSASDISSERIRTQFEVNLMGTVHVLEAVMPAMLKRRAGHIAVVSSVAGYRGLPTGAAYGATKAALINLCESLKFDLDRSGVRIQLVNPGFIKTPLTDKNAFRMPFLMPVDKAVDRMIAGFRTSRFEITFPRRFTWQLKLMRCLPYGLYFALTRRVTGA